MDVTKNSDGIKRSKFNFEEHRTAESAEVVLRAMFPNGANAADFLAVLVDAGANCVKEPMVPYLTPEQVTNLGEKDPALLQNSRMLHCRYSKAIAGSVATEWEVKTVEYPDGRIKGLRVYRRIVGP